MKVGVLGTGMVGSAIAGKLNSLGHDVMVGSRDPGGEKAKALGLPVGSYAEAAAHGHWVINALPGEAGLGYLGQCELEARSSSTFPTTTVRWTSRSRRRWARRSSARFPRRGW
jgi:predicted dinucleotide-binding enzyme